MLTIRQDKGYKQPDPSRPDDVVEAAPEDYVAEIRRLKTEVDRLRAILLRAGLGPGT